METRHRTDHFIAGVQARAGGSVPELIETALASTLRVLGSQLSHTPTPVAEVLGEQLAAELERGRKERPVPPAELVVTLARRGQVRPAVALELIESVIAELSAHIGPDGRNTLRRLLDPAWAALVIDPRPPDTDAHAPAPPRQVGTARTLAAARPRADTLAAGRPGSKHPVADAD